MEQNISVDNSKELPTLLSFCTGYGGVERGIESVIGPVRTLAHVEIEAYAIANLVDKMEQGSMLPSIITKGDHMHQQMHNLMLVIPALVIAFALTIPIL